MAREEGYLVQLILELLSCKLHDSDEDTFVSADDQNLLRYPSYQSSRSTAVIHIEPDAMESTEYQYIVLVSPHLGALCRERGGCSQSTPILVCSRGVAPCNSQIPRK